MAFPRWTLFSSCCSSPPNLSVKNMSLSFCNTRADNKILPMKPKSSYMGKRLSFLTLGPSLAGSSDILIASSIAARSPLPPSPLKAGPKHSGLRMRRRTTTFAFSSTLSPTRNRDHSSYRLLIRSRIRNNEEIKMKCYNEMLKKKIWPLTKTAKRRKSRYFSPPQGFQPMSGYPLASSIGQLWSPHPAKYFTTWKDYECIQVRLKSYRILNR